MYRCNEFGLISWMKEYAMDFSAAEMVAIEGAVSGKDLLIAKDALADGETRAVNFTIRITGNIQKGFGTPSATSERPAEVSLCGMTVFCALLRELGIGPKRLKDALYNLPATSELEVDEQLTNVFDVVARKLADALPPVTVTTPGRRGAVKASVSVTRL